METTCADASVLVAGCPLPELSTGRMRQHCKQLEATLNSYDPDKYHLKHIQMFSDKGPALPARLSRCIGYMLATIHLKRTSGAGNATSACNASFSHSGKAAFFAYREETGSLGLDAEPADRCIHGIERFCSPQKRLLKKENGSLLSWLVLEACLKAAGHNLASAPFFIPEIVGHRQGISLVDKQKIFWKLLPFPGHWICLASSHQFAGVKRIWFPFSHLANRSVRTTDAQL